MITNRSENIHAEMFPVETTISVHIKVHVGGNDEVLFIVMDFGIVEIWMFAVAVSNSEFTWMRGFDSHTKVWVGGEVDLLAVPNVVPCTVPSVFGAFEGR